MEPLHRAPSTLPPAFAGLHPAAAVLRLEPRATRRVVYLDPSFDLILAFQRNFFHLAQILFIKAGSGKKHDG